MTRWRRRGVLKSVKGDAGWAFAKLFHVMIDTSVWLDLAENRGSAARCAANHPLQRIVKLHHFTLALIAISHYFRMEIDTPPRTRLRSVVLNGIEQESL